MTAERVTVGTVGELEVAGCVTAKAGSRPICVFWNEGEPHALDDRCPHMGFPLHRGTVESGLVTCHWHNARFDLETGATLDLWADDGRAYPVEVVGDEVVVTVGPEPERTGYHTHRLEEGLEQGITLVMAKAVLGLLDAGVPAAEIVRVGAAFGLRYREAGWGAGLTVLTAMANVLAELDDRDRALALVQGLAFLSSDTRGRPPRFDIAPLAADAAPPVERLAAWYRRFVDTRSGGAAERALVSAVAVTDLAEVATVMFAAVTDHVFLDGGHTLDFTNKAFELLDHLGAGSAPAVLPTLVSQTAAASRSEERGSWRHPIDLTELLRTAAEALPRRMEQGATAGGIDDDGVAALAWAVLADDPFEVVGAVDLAVEAGAIPEQLGRAVAYAAALRIVRFHTQNDHGDWDEVHHTFTAANALHQALGRVGDPVPLVRGVYHSALSTYLDRFLNVPAARLPSSPDGGGASGRTVDLAALADCWDREGGVDEAAAIVHGHLVGGGDPGEVIAALGHALLREDAGFHWYQTYEAAVRQFHAWPEGGEEGRLVLVAAARFLAAHTPTRRERSQVVRIATRLRRGEPLFEDDDEDADASRRS